jgi:flagellar biosynthesis protein FlhB
MAEAGGGERTEDPTPKKLADAKRDGDRLQSKELAVALVMCAGLGWMLLCGQWLADALQAMLTSGLRIDHHDIEDAAWGSRLSGLLLPLLLPFGGLIAATWVASMAGSALLGSLAPSWKNITFKSSRISPLAGLKRIFGTAGLIELFKSIVKVLAVGGIGLWFLVAAWPEMIGLAHMDARSASATIGDIFGGLMAWMLGSLIILAAIDVPVARFQRLARLKMTKQQVQDEHKEAEGSPERKSAQRAAAHAILSRSVRKGVKEAQLVLVNPTHFAVALRYRPGLDAAPVMVARGADARAFAIRDLAGGHAVPVLHYPDLTRAIYFTSREGQMIDERLFVAVATLLAFIFRIDAMAAEQATYAAKSHAPNRFGPPPLPSVSVPSDLQFDVDGKPG